MEKFNQDLIIKNGIFHGPEIHYHKNGNIKRKGHLYMVKYGRYYSFYEGWFLSVTVPYRNGKKEGYLKHFSKEGEIKSYIV